MSVNALAAGWAALLTTDQTSGSFHEAVGGRIYESIVPEEANTLPVCRWQVLNDIPRYTLSDDHIDAEVQVDLWAEADAGSAALAGIADKLITLCQQASPTISGFSGVNVIATDRGAVTLDDGELRHTSRWRVQANQ